MIRQAGIVTLSIVFGLFMFSCSSETVREDVVVVEEDVNDVNDIENETVSSVSWVDTWELVSVFSHRIQSRQGGAVVDGLMVASDFDMSYINVPDPNPWQPFDGGENKRKFDTLPLKDILIDGEDLGHYIMDKKAFFPGGFLFRNTSEQRAGVKTLDGLVITIPAEISTYFLTSHIYFHASGKMYVKLLRFVVEYPSDTDIPLATLIQSDAVLRGGTYSADTFPEDGSKPTPYTFTFGKSTITGTWTRRGNTLVLLRDDSRVSAVFEKVDNRNELW